MILIQKHMEWIILLTGGSEYIRIFTDCESQLNMVVGDSIFQGIQTFKYHASIESLSKISMSFIPMALACKPIDDHFLNKISKYKNKLEIIANPSGHDTKILLNDVPLKNIYGINVDADVDFSKIGIFIYKNDNDEIVEIPINELQEYII